MNKLDLTTDEVIQTPDATENESVAGDIQIDGESFHIEEFAPTAEEYRELVDGLYKSFYEQDLERAISRAIEEKRTQMKLDLDEEIKKREQEIKEKTRLEVLGKISKRRLRPDEIGIMVQHKPPSRDVSKMTKEERAQAARRAACGQIINFK